MSTTDGISGRGMTSGSGTAEGVADAGTQVHEDVKNLGAEATSFAAAKAGQVKDAAQEYYAAGKDKAQQYLDAGKEKAQEYLGVAKDKGQEYLDTGKERVKEYYDAGRAQAEEYYEMGKARAHDFEESVEEYIRQKPIQSVLIAAGVGAALGLLLRR